MVVDVETVAMFYRRESKMQIGTIVKLKRDCLDNPKGALGVVFYDYGGGFQAIFPNGNYDGFNTEEVVDSFGGLTEADFILEKVGFEPSLSGYQFRNVITVDRDFRCGVFDAVLKRKDL